MKNTILILICTVIASFSHAQRFEGDAILQALKWEVESEEYKAFLDDFDMQPRQRYAHEYISAKHGIGVEYGNEQLVFYGVSKQYQIDGKKIKKFKGQLPLGLKFVDYTKLKGPRKLLENSYTTTEFLWKGYVVTFFYGGKKRVPTKIYMELFEE